MIIDGHCHLGIGHEYRQTTDELLAEMDRYDVDRAVICQVDRCIAVDNREGNDEMLHAVREQVARPERFDQTVGNERTEDLRAELATRR